MRTVSVRKEDVERKWLVVDAEGKVLGRMASQVATILRGKHKPFFTPHVDCGDFVIVVNADKVRLTGKKLLNKSYYFHSNYPGGLKTVQAGKMLEKRPVRMVELAVRRMLPKTKLGRAMFKKLKVYASPDHPHEAQRPEPLEIEA
ncbi:50S ribosomal protein L13 [Nitrospinae bacterium AH_259_B05_G02_I21]|nr:50S ribosomal protein L13 [Nitrospinae bacterium AH_259_B05_G02_I21]MDA2931985.1 50S ribosomal protein L13 [Nitrospinae bacterium AH-259-F20]